MPVARVDEGLRVDGSRRLALDGAVGHVAELHVGRGDGRRRGHGQAVVAGVRGVARLGGVVEHHPVPVVVEDARRGLGVRLLPGRRVRQGRRAVAAVRVGPVARVGRARHQRRDVVAEGVTRREGVVGAARVDDLGVGGVTASLEVVRGVPSRRRGDERRRGARCHGDVRRRGARPLKTRPEGERWTRPASRMIPPIPTPASLLFRLMRCPGFVVDRWFAGSLIGGLGERRALCWQSFPIPVSDRRRWSLREQRNSRHRRVTGSAQKQRRQPPFPPLPSLKPCTLNSLCRRHKRCPIDGLPIAAPRSREGLSSWVATG